MLVTLECDLYSLHRLADDNEDNAPFQINYLDLGYEPNSYSAYAAYQSPPV